MIWVEKTNPLLANISICHRYWLWTNRKILIIFHQLKSDSTNSQFRTDYISSFSSFCKAPSITMSNPIPDQISSSCIGHILGFGVHYLFCICTNKIINLTKTIMHLWPGGEQMNYIVDDDDDAAKDTIAILSYPSSQNTRLAVFSNASKSNCLTKNL